MILGPLILAASISAHSEPPSESTRGLISGFRDKMRQAHLYLEPEFPSTCLDWKAVTKDDDSIWVVPVVAKTRTCADVHVGERWILARQGGDPLLASGRRWEVRTPLELLTAAVPSDQDGLYGTQESESDGEDVIDLILAGGGAKEKPAKPRSSESRAPRGNAPDHSNKVIRLGGSGGLNKE